MNEELQKQIDTLKREVADLKTWKESKTRQQLTHPLDKESKDLLVKENFIKNEKILYFQDITSAVFSTMLFRSGTVNSNQLTPGGSADKFSQVFLNDPVRQFSADSTNVCTSQNHGFVNNDPVVLYHSTTDLDLPSPLVTGATYYIVSAITDTFKLSATAGGAEIDITDAGTGEHFLTYQLL